MSCPVEPENGRIISWDAIKRSSLPNIESDPRSYIRTERVAVEELGKAFGREWRDVSKDFHGESERNVTNAEKMQAVIERASRNTPDQEWSQRLDNAPQPEPWRRTSTTQPKHETPKQR